MKRSHSIFLIPCSILWLLSCTVSKQISNQANKILINDSVLSQGHVGISIYEPATGKYWYNYDADKYFVPASNTKLFTLYAGMKYLGDSIVGLRYLDLDDSTTVILPAGDPTFLHPDFKEQRVFSFLQQKKKISYELPSFFKPMGTGWAWDDYKEGYMAQRSNLPIYGNVIRIKKIAIDSIIVEPKVFSEHVTIMESLKTGFEVVKTWDDNQAILLLNGTLNETKLPFRPHEQEALLGDTLHKKIFPTAERYEHKKFKILYSRPSDSLFKPMMYNSDNFFAEQTLLMASNERLGYMSDENIIDTLLTSDLRDVPQRPRWVDGSGLSRYNLFTPMSFVYILGKMQKEFGLERLQRILAPGGSGTLQNYYTSNVPYLYAKTGTVGNITALSGILYTKKGKQLIFSILINNYQVPATSVRRAIEKFLVWIRENN